MAGGDLEGLRSRTMGTQASGDSLSGVPSTKREE